MCCYHKLSNRLGCRLVAPASRHKAPQGGLCGFDLLRHPVGALKSRGFGHEGNTDHQKLDGFVGVFFGDLFRRNKLLTCAEPALWLGASPAVSLGNCGEKKGGAFPALTYLLGGAHG